jgi:hypothetical protein
MDTGISWKQFKMLNSIFSVHCLLQAEVCIAGTLNLELHSSNWSLNSNRAFLVSNQQVDMSISHCVTSLALNNDMVTNSLICRFIAHIHKSTARNCVCYTQICPKTQGGWSQVYETFDCTTFHLASTSGMYLSGQPHQASLMSHRTSYVRQGLTIFKSAENEQNLVVPSNYCLNSH